MKMTMSLVGVLILCAASVAQDAPEQPEKKPIKPLELYKEVGRAWSYDLLRWSRVGSAERGTEVALVMDIADNQASYRVRRDWRNGESHRETGSVQLDAEPSADWGAYADPSLPRETLASGFATFECTRHVETMEGIQTTTWVSVEYHPLVVKQVKLGKDSCETRTLKSFEIGGIDPFGLYKVAGRSMKFKSTEYSVHLRVKECTATTVTIEMTAYKADGSIEHGPEVETAEFSEIYSMPESVSITESGGETTIVRKPWPVSGEATVKVEAGEFDCVIYEHPEHDRKDWRSKQWPALVVKEKREDGTAELTELDLGHDALRLFRKAGNYSVTRSVTSFGGMEVEAKIRMEVSSLEEGTAKVVTIYEDAEGNEQLRQDMDRPVKELELPAMPYTAQIEESVTTPAGTFRCIKAEAEGITTWTYHGVVVRMETDQQGAKVAQELIELKME